MAVGTTASVIRYTVTIGGATSFTFPYAFYDDTDLVVTMYETSGDITTLEQSTDYTISPIYGSYQNGGVVTFVDDDYWEGTLVIQRIVPLLQQTDYQDYSNFPADVFEGDLDRLTMMVQQLDEKIGRQLTVPVVDVDPGVEFPVAADRASKFVAFDAEGDVILASGVPEVPVTPFMETLLDDMDAETARTTLEVPSLFEETLSLGTSAAVGDIIAYKNDGSAWIIGDPGEREIIGSGYGNQMKMCALSSTLLIVMYRDATNINCVACSVAADGTIGAPGSAVSFAGLVITEHMDISRMDDTTFVVVYRKQADTYGYARVMTVSGTTITMGAESQFYAAAVTGARVAGLSASLIVVIYGNSSSYAKCRAATVSGTTPTWGTEVDAVDGGTHAIGGYSSCAIGKVDGTHFLIAAQITTSPFNAVAQGAISGSTITMGYSKNPCAGTTGYGMYTQSSYNGFLALCMAVQDSEGSSSYPSFNSWILSVISPDTSDYTDDPFSSIPCNITDKSHYSWPLHAFLNDEYVVLVSMRQVTYKTMGLWAKFIRLTNAGTTAVNVTDKDGWYELVNDYYTQGAYGDFGVCRLDDDRFIIAYSKDATDLFVRAFSLPNFAGFALETGTNPNVRMAGKYVDAGLSLDPGCQYYLTPKGTLEKDFVSRHAYVGKAYSATGLMLGG